MPDLRWLHSGSEFPWNWFYFFWLVSWPRWDTITNPGTSNNPIIFIFSPFLYRASPEGQNVNEPISEHEIRAIFSHPVFDLPCKTSGQTPIRGHNRSSRSRESTPGFKGRYQAYYYKGINSRKNAI